MYKAENTFCKQLLGDRVADPGLCFLVIRNQVLPCHISHASDEASFMSSGSYLLRKK